MIINKNFTGGNDKNMEEKKEKDKENIQEEAEILTPEMQKIRIR